MNVDLIASLPLIVVSVGAMFILLLDLFGLRLPRPISATVVCAVSWYFSLPSFSVDSSQLVLGGLMHHDPFSFVFNTLILSGSLLTIILHSRQLEAQRVTETADIDVLVLLAAAGAMAMVSAAHFVVLFLAFEVLSVAVYVLSGLARREKSSAEGALKYFVLGAFSSAFLLYGMTLVYGATGSLYLSEIVHALGNANAMLLLGIGLIIFGFGFKVSLVPFHFWTADVYQGAPISITGFMAVVVKAAAFGAFLRLFAETFADLQLVWRGNVVDIVSAYNDAWKFISAKAAKFKENVGLFQYCSCGLCFNWLSCAW